MFNKKIYRKLLMPLILSSVLILSGCDLDILPSFNTKDYTSFTDSATTSNDESSSITGSTTSSGSDSGSSYSSATSTSDEASEISQSSESSITSSDSEPPVPTQSLTINSNTYYSGFTQYNTGNYGINSLADISFEYYRLYKNNSFDEIYFLPNVGVTSDGTLPAALLNRTAIRDIKTMEVRYKTESTSGNAPRLYYGDDKSVPNYVELPKSTSWRTEIVTTTSAANYFRLESGTTKLTLDNLEINYTNTGTAATFTHLSAGADHYRTNPVVSNGMLYEGQEVTVPIAVSRVGNSYSVTETKTYTYYSFDYVESYQYALGDVSRFAYTDPADLAAFFSAFGTYPANYVFKANFDNAKAVFGFDARQVSYYTRTDGYANAIPWRASPYGNYPEYYELDIDLDGSYYYGVRGVGRLVCWEYGFDANGYDYAPVCLYTDDHYATFQEYLNTGTFGTRFNSYYSSTQSMRTNYVWGAPITLN